MITAVDVESHNYLCVCTHAQHFTIVSGISQQQKNFVMSTFNMWCE